METTWDGLPVGREEPVAVCVVVWRAGPGGREFLVLHRRAAGGADCEGEWAWTPPAGARLPGERVEDAVRRELREETGLDLALATVDSPVDRVALFVAEAPTGADVVLDDEHDRYEWLPLREACARCLPPIVAEELRAAAAVLA